MKTIRHNVFETNSSSTHSISINSTTELYDSITPDSNGVITLTGGEFGWEWQQYNDALTKANYCAVDSYGNGDLEKMLRDVIMEHTGAKDVVFDLTTDYRQDNYSYIDHQSVGTSHPAFSSSDNLKNFIFNPKSYLFTGNDNGDEPANFYDVGVEDFTHQIVLEGSREVYKLKQSDINDSAKIVDAVLNLFSRNIYNQYNSDRTCWSSDSEKLYMTPYREENRGVDIANNRLKIVKETAVYKKDGSFDDYKLDEEKFLKYSIVKI